MWTRFMDMHSGGGRKEGAYEHIYIEAPEEEAKRIFYGKFGHNPDRVTCTCCGKDYSITEYDSLEQASSYERNVPYLADGNTPDTSATHGRYGRPVIPLEKYIVQPDVFVLRAADILPEWRTCEIPQQGYVWVE